MLYKLKEYDKSLQILFTLTPSEISQFFYIPMKKAIALYHEIHSIELKRKVKNDAEYFLVITCFDKTYPKNLLMIPDAPLVLYTLGNPNIMNWLPSISVIGTRKPSHEAFEKLEFIVKPLIYNEYVIVSGLAYGVDSMAHELTLNQKGMTIAVLGSGFRHMYPKQNMHLFKQIIKTGLVVTEYPPDVRPRRYHFPERNRIISGLSKATLVIEATEKSGTLITVDQALEQGREVYAVPGSPILEQTVGCHKLIQDGAKLVRTAEDILEDWA